MNTLNLLSDRKHRLHGTLDVRDIAVLRAVLQAEPDGDASSIDCWRSGCTVGLAGSAHSKDREIRAAATAHGDRFARGVPRQ